MNAFIHCSLDFKIKILNFKKTSEYFGSFMKLSPELFLLSKVSENTESSFIIYMIRLL